MTFHILDTSAERVKRARIGPIQLKEPAAGIDAIGLGDIDGRPVILDHQYVL